MVYTKEEPNYVFHVNLRIGSCDCCFFEDYGIPCSHIIAAASHDSNFSYSKFVHAFYQTKTYKIGLEKMRHIVPIEGLPTTPGITPCKSYNKVIPKRRHLFGWERNNNFI